MKITSQLALSQLKLNKKRTMAGISAISLATALVTAVMCFATSGNRMLTVFLEPGYGDYSSVYFLLIFVPVLILGILIALMSVTVISNIFVASANKRIQEFGILKCVGGTGKQIRACVICESLWLCVVGIPLGLMAGTLLGYIGIKITGYFVSNIDQLSKSIIMRPFSFSLSFHISVWTYLFASFFSFLIVLRSAYKPAKTVGRLTAIQCVKGITTDINLKELAVKGGLAGKIFGCEGEIAWKNIKRNQSGYKATVRALSLAILLFLMTGGLAEQAKEFQEWMTPESKEMDVDYCSIRNIEVNKRTGRTEEKIVSPISSITYNEITKRLAEYGNIEVYGVGNDACTYQAILDKNFLSKDMSEAPDIFDENAEAGVSLISVDEKLYQKLCDRAGAPYGSNLLINSYQYNDNGRTKSIKPFGETVTEITLINAAEEKKRIEIGGFLYQEDLKEPGFRDMSPDPVRIVVPDVTARYFDWFCTPDDEQAFAEYARKIMDEYYPVLTEDSYVDQGYTVRISRMDTMAKMLNIAIILAEIILYGFVILLIFMGFASVINTLAANIRIRGREFAILKSVGMTNASIQKMLYCESLICIIKALIPGTVLGIAIPFAMNLSIRKAFPVLYHIPWGMLIAGVVVLTVVVMIITWAETTKQKDKSIIDEIRMDVV